ncbi:MAG: hypothetical protein IJ354_01775 [Clostridia bacterium]|nr:hypothetical protein [Clostridia bacterium]
MKERLIRICTVLACLLAVTLACGCAMAAEGIVAESGRTTWRAYSDGLAFAENGEPTYDPVTGMWTMTIDTNQTNWQAVVAAGVDESGDVKGLDLTILPASSETNKASAIYSSGTSGGTQAEWDAWLAREITREPNRDHAEYGAGTSLSLGHYDSQSGTFLPQATKEDEIYTLFVRVRYADGSYDSRYVKVAVSFTNQNPKRVSFSNVSYSNILPNFGGTAFSANVSDGSAEYSNPTSTPQAGKLVTAVRAPGTKEQTAGWTASLGRSKLTMSTDSDGHCVALIEMNLPAESYAATESGVIIWKAGDVTKACEKIIVKVVHGTPLLWPEYVDALVPFEKNDVELKLVGGIGGVSLEKDGNATRLALDTQALLSAASAGQDLTQAAVQIRLKAPANARYYAGGDVVYGSSVSYGPTMADNFYPNGVAKYPPYELLPIDSTWIAPLDLSYFYMEKQTKPSGDGEMDYYMSCWTTEATEFGAAVQIIQWFDDEKQLIGENYIVFTFDALDLISLEEVLTDESGLSEHPNVPRVVIKDKWDGTGKVSLMAERLPSSPGSHYYHLTLVDENNEPVYLEGQTCDVYLPYPDHPIRYTRETAQDLELTIGHYDSEMNLVEEVFSVTKGNLELTPYGMRLRVSSFSPFIVNWKLPAETAAADVPQTGDHSAPLLWLCLMGMAGVCMLMLSKRARN